MRAPVRLLLLLVLSWLCVFGAPRPAVAGKARHRMPARKALPIAFRYRQQAYQEVRLPTTTAAIVGPASAYVVPPLTTAEGAPSVPFDTALAHFCQRLLL
jgi:hypothetical protein